MTGEETGDDELRLAALNVTLPDGRYLIAFTFPGDDDDV